MGEGHTDTPAKRTEPPVASAAKIVNFYCHFAFSFRNSIGIVIAAGGVPVKIRWLN
jgi:hypothetical protein